MNDALKNEIFSLIEAPELREYLLSLPEDLNGKQYEQIIVGAPVGLKKKLKLLRRLKTEISFLPETLQSLEKALNALENVESPCIVLLAELWGCQPNERIVRFLDGPFPVQNFRAFQKSMHAYRCKFPEYFNSQFWQIKLYDLSQRTDQSAFGFGAVVKGCNVLRRGRANDHCFGLYQQDSCRPLRPELHSGCDGAGAGEAAGKRKKQLEQALEKHQ